MSEEEVFGLIRANKNFIDITEKDNSLYVTKRAGTACACSPGAVPPVPPRSPSASLNLTPLTALICVV